MSTFCYNCLLKAFSFFLIRTKKNIPGVLCEWLLYFADCPRGVCPPPPIAVRPIYNSNNNNNEIG